MNIKMFKDTDYHETLTYIKCILDNLDLNVTEKITQNSKTVFSVRLYLTDSKLGVNGKGMTQDQALASAYAELLERIQSSALYKFQYPISEAMLTAQDYYVSPDEQFIEFDSFYDLPHNHWPRNILSETYRSKKENSNLYNCLMQIEREKNQLIAIPFKNYITQEVRYVPERLLQCANGTNGMTAGNTLEEAFVSGICELFERHVNKIVYSNKIRLPTVPLNEINDYEFCDLVHEIENSGDYQIFIKDTSVVSQLPVAMVILCDTKQNQYFVKFGCHPIFEIAAFRALIEILQGRKLIFRHYWMRKFTFNLEKRHTFDKICRTGEGSYWPEIFIDEKYEKSDIWVNSEEEWTNIKLLEYLIGLLDKNNWSLWYYDYSFLGFHTYQLVIDGICYNNKLDENYFASLNQKDTIQPILNRIHHLSGNDLMTLKDYFFENEIIYNDLIQSIIKFPICYYTGYYRYKVLDLYVVVLLRLNQYERALHVLDTYKGSNLFYSEDEQIWNCLHEILIAKQYEYSYQEINNILTKIYDDVVVKKTLSLFNESNFFFDSFIDDDSKCGKCSLNCPIQEPCKTAPIYSLHKKIYEYRNSNSRDKNE